MEVPLLPEREEERKLMVVVLPRLAFLEELKTLSFLSAPPAGVACFRFFLLATATMMVGHLGKLSLDSIAIANSLINVIGFIPLRLCGQAHGAEQYQKIGTYTYPAMFFCIAICIPISVLWIFMDKVLILLGQDPDFFVEACNYAIWLILTLFGYAILRSLSHNLQAQSLILALFLSSCATLCLQILLCWVLVSKTDFGNTGAELTIVCLLFPITKVSNGVHMRFCTRVANELGAGNPEPTRLSTCVVIFLAVAEAAIGSVALFCCRNVLAYLFNTDKDVVNYVSELVPA
ncbi:protein DETOXIFICATION 8 [Citrus sinensis]|uniref:Protein DETOXIFICATION 8 n=1 Tax=Citrus sinensis TaxID=2711 RepID=A0ACB8K3F7_CITSI|nr:protein DETOXIFICATION 8 [Citrus sinensis]